MPMHHCEGTQGQKNGYGQYSSVNILTHHVKAPILNPAFSGKIYGQERVSLYIAFFLAHKITQVNNCMIAMEMGSHVYTVFSLCITPHYHTLALVVHICTHVYLYIQAPFKVQFIKTDRLIYRMLLINYFNTRASNRT